MLKAFKGRLWQRYVWDFFFFLEFLWQNGMCEFESYFWLNYWPSWLDKVWFYFIRWKMTIFHPKILHQLYFLFFFFEKLHQLYLKYETIKFLIWPPKVITLFQVRVFPLLSILVLSLTEFNIEKLMQPSFINIQLWGKLVF